MRIYLASNLVEQVRYQWKLGYSSRHFIKYWGGGGGLCHRHDAYSQGVLKIFSGKFLKFCIPAVAFLAMALVYCLVLTL